jgi:tripartite-type tricarboxylate transporter receptor subunit TctC
MRTYGTAVLLVALWNVLAMANAGAQTDYPQKPIRIVVGFPPGGPADTAARLLGQEFARAFGKPALVDNVPGAAGNIAATRVANATPDGYTVALMTEGQVVINPGLYTLPFSVSKDFEPVSQVSVSPYLLVAHPGVSAMTVEGLVAVARTRGALTYASAGIGSTPQMAAELFKSVARIELRHVPYKGVANAVTDLVGGRVMVMFSPLAASLPMVRDGKLRALAVTSLTRSLAVPEVPAIAESGYPGFEVTGWLGLLAPAKTPPMIVGKLHTQVVTALASPEVRARLAALGLDGIGSTPDEFAAAIQSGLIKWSKVITEAGIKVE